MNKKTATVVALTDFKEGQAELNNIARKVHAEFNSTVPHFRKPEQGFKSQLRERQHQKLIAGTD